MPLRVLELHPAVPQSWWWWLVVAALLLAGIALMWVGVARWRRLRRVDPEGADDTLERLRAEAMAEIDLGARATPPEEGARLIGLAVRRFAGIASDGDADFLTTAQLRVASVKDPGLAPVHALSQRVDGLAYGGAQPSEVADLADAAREVILAWR